MTVFLVGYMACGKTTLGRALNRIYGLEFIDLDEYIERQTGLSPSEWFVREGEAAFRSAEIEAVESLCRPSQEKGNQIRIVGCGGGTACSARALDKMLQEGKVIWLKASLERTVIRLLEADGQRPLVAGMNADELKTFIPSHLSSREKHYARAHDVFDSSYLDTAQEIESTAEEFYRKYLA